MDKQLKDKTILVTRPEGQNQSLEKMLSEHGAEVILLPTIEIHPLNGFNDSLRSIMFDIIIFTSSNAVKCANLSLINASAKIVAIGKNTKEAISKHGISCHYCPEANFSSETLLEAELFKSLFNKNILIITGKNGRDYLKNELVKRGANVFEYFCYERSVPKVAASVIMNLAKKKIDYVICTSNETLENLMCLLKGKLDIREVQVIGFSNRLIPLAKKLGFSKTPVITNEASNAAIVSTLIQYLAKLTLKGTYDYG